MTLKWTNIRRVSVVSVAVAVAIALVDFSFVSLYVNVFVCMCGIALRDLTHSGSCMRTWDSCCSSLSSVNSASKADRVHINVKNEKKKNWRIEELKWNERRELDGLYAVAGLLRFRHITGMKSGSWNKKFRNCPAKQAYIQHTHYPFSWKKENTIK